MSNKTLRDLRDQTVKSREEVARELHTTGRMVDAYENGTRRLGIKQVFILAKFYNCTVGEVIRAESNMEQYGGTIHTIEKVFAGGGYHLSGVNGNYTFTDAMLDRVGG